MPGDYATIQAAVTALAPIGGTICLTEPSYTESVTGTGTSSLTIQGVSVASTVVTGNLTFDLPVNLRGFQVNGTIQLGVGPSVVANMTIANQFSDALQVYADATVTASTVVQTNGVAVRVGSGQNSFDVLLDGVDISGGQGEALDLPLSTTSSNSTLTVQNSYIHDSGQGMLIFTDTTTFVFVNNTFVNAGTAFGLYCYVGDQQVSGLTYENNVFVNNKTAVYLDTTCTMVTPPLFASNGYYGNTTNFDGTAAEGTGDVKTNPLLQTTITPPTLGAGSPAIGAGLKSVAPATDYWGNPRGASVDLGCVQSP